MRCFSSSGHQATSVCVSVYSRTCNDELGVEQTGVFLQSVIVNVASFWIHLKNRIIKSHQIQQTTVESAPNRPNMEMWRDQLDLLLPEICLYSILLFIMCLFFFFLFTVVYCVLYVQLMFTSLRNSCPTPACNACDCFVPYTAWTQRRWKSLRFSFSRSWSHVSSDLHQEGPAPWFFHGAPRRPCRWQN